MPADRTLPRDLRALELMEVAPAGDGWGGPLAARLSHLLGISCRLRAPPEDFALPELPGRDQVDADRLLERAEALGAPDDEVLVLLTGRDMGHPIFTHFFGRARRGGRAVVVSTARLDPATQGLAPDESLTLARASREVLHELGHAYGLDHCRQWDCVMRFAATVEALDNRGGGYCPRCARYLPEGLLRAQA